MAQNMEQTSRSNRGLLTISLWLMAAIYFFLFLAAALLADYLAKHLLIGKCELTILTPWAFYLFMEQPLLGAFPTIMAIVVISCLVFKAQEKDVLRYFLFGFITWLCGLLVLSFCCFTFVMPLGIACTYHFENTDYYVLWIVLASVIPPLIPAVLALIGFLKNRKAQ